MLELDFKTARLIQFWELQTKRKKNNKNKIKLSKNRAWKNSFMEIKSMGKFYF